MTTVPGRRAPLEVSSEFREDAAMPQTPLVSIVINNFNYGRFLHRAVESALEQTYENIEVIVVDDGSTDDSRSILKGYEDRVSIILQENSGQARAFNVGITAAKGEYTLLLDSDDYLLPNAVARCVACFPAGHSRVYYRLRTVDELGAVLNEAGVPSHFWPFEGDIFQAIRQGAQPFFSVPTSGNFFASDKLRAILPIPEKEFRICADSFVLVRTSLEGPVKSIDEVLGMYRIHTRNNFSSAVFKYSDKKRVTTHIENYYRTRSLVVDACRTAGFNYSFFAEESNSFVTQCLCIGHRLGIHGQYMAQWGTLALFRLAGKFLRHGDGSVQRRLAIFAYLSSVLFLPTPAAHFLIRTRDSIAQRKSSKSRPAQNRSTPIETSKS